MKQDVSESIKDITVDREEFRAAVSKLRSRAHVETEDRRENKNLGSSPQSSHAGAGAQIT